MRNIAVTGSFATGKTHIINCIINLGYKTFSCDDYVKLLYQDRSIKFQIEQASMCQQCNSKAFCE